MGRLGDKKLFLLDMDGTIYIDEELFPRTKPFLADIKRMGGRYLFLTNNSSKSVKAYVEKLGRLGIPAAEEDFLTSVDAMIDHLKSGKEYRLYYPLARKASAASWRRPDCR